MTSIPFSSLVIAVALIVLVIVALGVFAAIRRSAAEPTSLRGTGRSGEGYDRSIWGIATVVSARHTLAFERGQDKARVSLGLRVKQTDGRTYQATAVWIVSLVNLPQVQPGQSVSIRIDPDDPRRILPAVAWAAPDLGE